MILTSIKGFERYGFVVHDNGDITYREWAPNAVQANLIGDFSTASPPNHPIQLLSDPADEWSRDATPMRRDDFGVWEVRLPAKDGRPAIPHNSKVKVCSFAPITEVFV
jgi:1,4-alpha-glucan branching enzyme